MAVSQEECISRFKKVHGNRYDYLLAKYTGSHNKVKIICSKHGLFEQAAYSHWSGKGCLKCANKIGGFNNIKLTQKDCIERFVMVHGNIYDYSLVKYKGQSYKVKIICKKHGIFEQSPVHHWNGSICQKCANFIRVKDRIISQKECISRFKKVHGNRYDYSLVEYENSHDKVKIICPVHGVFKQKAYQHWSGQNCSKCSKRHISMSAIDWLNYISKKDGIHIQHALNGGEYKIPGTRYKVDGFCKETNTCYEFHGDSFHGNPEIFEDNDYCNPWNQYITARELYKNTLQRMKDIKNLGYNIEYIWESDWNKIKNE